MCTVLMPPGGNPIAVKYIIYIVSYRITYIISYHIISYHIISYHIISYHIISYHIISYHIISYHIISSKIVMGQAVSVLPFNTETWAHSVTSLCGICGGKRITRTNSFRDVRFFPASIVGTILHIRVSSICHRR